MTTRIPTGRTPVALTLLALLVFTTALPASTATAGADAREGELNDLLAKAAEELEGDERTDIKEALEKYFDARERTLEALLKMIGSTDPKPLADKWEGPIESLQGTLNSTIGDCLDDIDVPTVKAFHFRMTVLNQEQAFLKGLLGLGVLAYRDTIVRSTNYLHDEDEDLQKKWEELRKQDQRLDEMEQSAAKEMRKLMEEAIEDAVKERREISEKLATLPGKLQKYRALVKEGVKQLPEGAIKTIAQVVLMCNEAVAKGCEIWLNTNSAVIARRIRITQLIKSEQGSIVKLFLKERNEAVKFVEQYGTVSARAAYKAAEADLKAWVSSCKTNGQKADAQDFTNRALKVLGDDMSENEDAMDQLLDEHEGRFLEGVNQETIEALAEPDYWEDECERIEDLAEKIEDLIKEWRDEALNVYVDSLDDLTDLERRTVQEQMKSRVEKLMQIMDKAMNELDSGKLIGPIEDAKEDLEDAVGD